MLEKLLPMLSEDAHTPGQTALSRHALWRLSRDSAKFRNATTSKQHFAAIQVHATRSGVMPIEFDPDVFLTSHERRNCKNDTEDALLMTSLIAKDSYRRHYHRVISHRAVWFSAACLVVSLIVALAVAVPYVRAHQHALVALTGAALGVKVADKPLGANAVLAAEVKHGARSAWSAGKDWLRNRKAAKNAETSQ